MNIKKNHRIVANNRLSRYKLPDDEQSSNIEVTGTELHTTCNKHPHCTTGPSLCGLLALSDKLEIAAMLPKDPVNKYMRIS